MRTLLAFALSLLPCTLAAQVTPIPRTGCGGSTAVQVQGQPRIGQRLSFSWTCRATDLPVLLFARALPVAYLPAPLACARGGCGVISPAPLFLAGTPGRQAFLATALPPDPSLVGFTFHVQGACVSRHCVDLGVGVAVRITR